MVRRCAGQRDGVLKSVLPQLRCPECHGAPLGAAVVLETEGRILDGVLTCPACRATHIIDDGLLELVPSQLVDASAST